MFRETAALLLSEGGSFLRGEREGREAGVGVCTEKEEFFFLGGGGDNSVVGGGVQIFTSNKGT